jgi:hypothetical protein
MATTDDLRRVIQRDLTSRDAKRVEPLLDAIGQQLEEAEQVVQAATGQWYGRRKCLLVATSRQLIAADERRLDAMAYEKLLAVDFNESWRTGRLFVRAHGAGADVSGLHLDRAREIHEIIRMARITSRPG